MRSAVLGCAMGFAAAIAHADAPGPARQDHQTGIRAGRQIYESHCASCHGARAEGAPHWERPDSLGELPAPPHDRQGHTWKHSDAMLYRIVRDGWRDPFNKTQRLTMPAFGKTLSPRETREVLDYLKTLWSKKQLQFQREESRAHPYPPEAR